MASHALKRMRQKARVPRMTDFNTPANIPSSPHVSLIFHVTRAITYGTHRKARGANNQPYLPSASRQGNINSESEPWLTFNSRRKGRQKRRWTEKEKSRNQSLKHSRKYQPRVVGVTQDSWPQHQRQGHSRGAAEMSLPGKQQGRSRPMKTCQVCNGKPWRSEQVGFKRQTLLLRVMVAHTLPFNGVRVCLGKVTFPKRVRKQNHNGFTSHPCHGTHRKQDLCGKELSHLGGLPWTPTALHLVFLVFCFCFLSSVLLQ